MVNELESMYKTLLSTEHSKEAKELCAALSKMKNVNKKLEQWIDEKRKIINWK